MAIEHSITFGGVNSADFGIYISGEGVFNAPKRDVEMISIPGRNGEIALDKGRYENIEVTYPAFNYEADYSDFAQNLADFRNAICSQVGYQRLTDTFHPDEYRMATYIDGLEIKPIKYNTASEFEITFNCKPQRWLTSGETPVVVTSGDELTNPTLYESSPLLEIAGYGHIQMGESSINIENVVIGNVVLANSGTMQGVRAYYDTETLALMKDGDNITLQAGSLLERGLAVVGYASASDTPYGATITVASTSEVQAHVQRVYYMEYYHSCFAELIIDEPIIVPKGVEVTKTLTLDVSLSYRVNGIAKTWAGSITYDIVFYPTYIYIPVDGHGDSLPSDLKYITRAGERNAEVTGASTMSIFEINHIFADCDLGEAYTIIDGEISSLNAYIDLGSDLPTLGAGANEVTYDNTVTELKISPRWWQL